MTRGKEYLCRVLFRPPCEVSLGTDARAGISLPADELPQYHDLLQLGPDEATLRFNSDMKIELTADGQLLKTKDIVEFSLAREMGDAWQLPLPVGTKGLIHFGDVRLLFKVQQQRSGLVLDTKVDGIPTCLACSQELKHAVLG